jgi:hypothetical protein
MRNLSQDELVQVYGACGDMSPPKVDDGTPPKSCKPKSCKPKHPDYHKPKSCKPTPPPSCN